MAESAAQQRLRYPLAAYNFVVNVGDVAMSFTEVSGLVREHQTLTYRHGLSYWEGESIVKLTFDKYVPVTMKRGLVLGRKSLYDWLESTEPRTMTVSLCDDSGSPAVTWHVRKALATKLDAPNLVASGNDAAVETLTLMVSGITVEYH
jgi:phage tail-like protein